MKNMINNKGAFYAYCNGVNILISQDIVGNDLDVEMDNGIFLHG